MLGRRKGFPWDLTSGKCSCAAFATGSSTTCVRTRSSSSRSHTRAGDRATGKCASDLLGHLTPGLSRRHGAVLGEAHELTQLFAVGCSPSLGDSLSAVQEELHFFSGCPAQTFSEPWENSRREAESYAGAQNHHEGVACSDGMDSSRFEEAVYVLHAFRKKSRKTRKTDVELARQRFRDVVRDRPGRSENERKV